MTDIDREETGMALAIVHATDWTFEMVPVASVKIDPMYHDPKRLDQRRAQRIADHFDIEAAGVLTVSERGDGTRWIFDGHHRVVAARLAGIKQLPAKVFRGMSVPDEARLFRRLSESVRLRQEHLWRARLAEGEPVALEITDLLTKHGASLIAGSGTPNPNTTRSYGVIEKIHSVGLLDRVLGIVREAWPEDPHGLDSVPLVGIGSFLYVYSGSFPHPDYRGDKRLIEKLGVYPASSIIRITKEILASVGSVGSLTGGRGGSVGGVGGGSLTAHGSQRRAVLATYNRKTRHQLADATPSDLKQMALGRSPW
jgi:hypothetical protein